MALASPVRLPWIDHLRTLVILLVVNMHACVTYSHVGSWYMMSEHEPSLAAKVPFILWQAHLQSFFMGLLFFVSGYFAQGSLARKGPAAFVRERLLRLGVPTLFYMFAIHPFILLVLNPGHDNFGGAAHFYARFITRTRWLGASGPLWFAFALLLFCLALAALRATGLRPGTDTGAEPPRVPAAASLWWFGLGLGAATFLVRLWQPLGTDVYNFQLGYFVQYIAAFTVGVRAARQHWLLPLAASARARRAGIIALMGGPIVLLALLIVGRRDGPVPYAGGWNPLAAGLAFWEQLTGLGLSLGLLAFFSRRLNFTTPVLRWLGDRSFGVYVWHAPVLVALAIAFRALPQNPYILASLLTVTGLAITFLIADLVRRIPGLRLVS